MSEKNASHEGSSGGDAAEPSDAVAAEAAAVPEAAAPAPAAERAAPKRDWSTWYWAIAVVSLVVVELYFYGHNGAVRVCVGKEGVHDFNLVGQLRNDENRWKFPYCEERTNLGLRSEFDELGHDAMKAACRRATLLHFKTEQADCMALENHWKRKVSTTQVMPWNKHFYRQLFWLDRR